MKAEAEIYDKIWQICGDENQIWGMLIQTDEMLPCSLTQKVVFPAESSLLRGPSVTLRQQNLNIYSFLILKQNLNVPPMCYLKDFLVWHIRKNTNPQGCNKPKLQSWHYCTQNSCTTCSDWSSNSHPGICSASESMDGTCICGKSSPLQCLCSTWVRAWMS